jgi:tRNA pseudouridine55 synthase
MAKRRPPTVHGLMIVDKPAGVTSHDVVNQLRRRLGEKRIGHAGTLDPDATGVLVIGVGSITRLLRFLTDQGKRYTADVVLGTETSTLDSSGEVTATHDMAGVTLAQARALAAEHLTGEIMQVPPMVSALKVDGRRLHELAREGIEVERQPRPVTIHELSIGATDDPMVFRIDALCSAGTYVRTLAADLGRLLGGGAHLRNLRRVSAGPFTEADASPPDTAELLAPLAAVRGMNIVRVDGATAALVRHGRPLPMFSGEPPWALVGDGDEVLAIYEPFTATLAKPTMVIPHDE